MTKETATALAANKADGAKGRSTMKIGTDEVIAWLIVGALAGSLAGMIVKRQRAGFGHLTNLAIGLIGALIGGFLFKLLRINLGLIGAITITSEEVVDAFVGSLVFLGLVWAIRKWWASRKGRAA
jgi:uncharacterized membrane protein YeaQ/YmgE (transglycosylase-associated protein family)